MPSLPPLPSQLTSLFQFLPERPRSLRSSTHSPLFSKNWPHLFMLTKAFPLSPYFINTFPLLPSNAFPPSSLLQKFLTFSQGFFILYIPTMTALCSHCRPCLLLLKSLLPYLTKPFIPLTQKFSLPHVPFKMPSFSFPSLTNLSSPRPSLPQWKSCLIYHFPGLHSPPFSCLFQPSKGSPSSHLQISPPLLFKDTLCFSQKKYFLPLVQCFLLPHCLHSKSFPSPMKYFSFLYGMFSLTST